ncbi:MAG TPA: alkaline phosphatase D family protein [Pirellulales bacterium]|nr:alkaline phosphatase D family protein [Pirellulales bacterium]
MKTVSAGAAGAAGLKSVCAAPVSVAFATSWPADADRVWIGPQFWANRLQDWQLHDGRLECLRGDAAFPMRTVHLLTHCLTPGAQDFEVTVRTGPVTQGPLARDAAVGFLVGAGGQTMDYRAAALIHHNAGPGGGTFAGIDGAGRAFIQSFHEPLKANDDQPQADGDSAFLPAEMVLRLVGREQDDKYCWLTISVSDAADGRKLNEASLAVETALAGNVALVSHPGSGKPATRWWFRDWRLSGTKTEEHEDRTCGPILCTQYTVNRGVLKLTAQLMPIGAADAQTVELQLHEGGQWATVATAEVTTPGYTATFRLTDWDASRDVPYRVAYRLRDAMGERPWHWSGTIRRDPTDKKTFVLAALSCVQQVDGRVDAGKSYNWMKTVWFPHADMLPNLARHDPDLLFFAGDQIYEGNPTRVVRQPADESLLDYLYKWYLWCWTYRDLTRDRPTVTIPDDHDVYQGNVWGAGGKPAREGDPGGLLGGYGMPPEWLNAMQRTQTSHLPDPYDDTPVEQGIGVYFTSLVWGGVGFAILEDRKFKSPPSIVKAEMTPDSHITQAGYDTRQADLPGATLLGDRQLEFLRAFAGDWSGQEMKAALSQTIFCNLQISSRGETAGQLDKDLDSNGWPQTGRRKALGELRRGFMLHVAGDQHLASVVRHGIDDFDDAVWSLCAPAVANLYERFWNPDYLPQNAEATLPPFMGCYEDGFHNKITVHAVANPVNIPRPGQFPDPIALHRKATGYAIVRFNKPERTATLEVWPRFVDPSDPASGGQYAGWPITVKQTDNDGRRPVAWLPTLEVKGMAQPVVKIDDESGELVYALRIAGNEFRPGVFATGSYQVSVGEPGTSRFRTLRLSTVEGNTAERCVIDLR